MAVLRTCHTARALETGSGQYVRGISLAMLASQCTSISGSECVGGNSLFVALIDNESGATATLWQLLTPTVGVNSLGQKSIGVVAILYILGRI